MRETFRVRDGNGNEYTVVCEWPDLDTSTRQRRSSRPGLAEYRLEDGRRLNSKGEDVFQIAVTGELLRRVR